tara:strand:- start:2126 stop:2287 length:162 start_codon:yes stop_codon:yes gene_type:complete
MPRKTTKGVIYYKPLKMTEPNSEFLRIIEAKPEEGFADNSVKKIWDLGFRLLF